MNDHDLSPRGDEREATGGRPAGNPPVRIEIVTLFPSLFDSWLSQGVVSRAVDRAIVEIAFTNLREFGVGKHQVTDDYPFGGGAGMVMKPEPLFDAINSLKLDREVPVILLSPAGRKFDQRVAEELASHETIVLVAGHYEGVDERVRQSLISHELSVGDYVLSSGELAAMVVVDATVRLLPGAISPSSTEEETFCGGLLEYPQYTRPADFAGQPVPEVLLSGHHGQVARWRREQALKRTLEVRPDLLETVDLTPEEKELIEEWKLDVPDPSPDPRV